MLGLIPRLIDAFADVAMGMYTDSHTTRWGRYRPYFLVFAVPFGLSVMLVFTTPDLSYSGKLIWAYATYILMMLVFTAVDHPLHLLARRVDGRSAGAAFGQRVSAVLRQGRGADGHDVRSALRRPVGAGTNREGLPGFDGGNGRQWPRCCSYSVSSPRPNVWCTRTIGSPCGSRSSCSVKTING